MRILSLVVIVLLVSPPPTRSPDIPFRSLLIDNGASETAAVVDVNKDGKLDIISGEHWYQAPSWTKHKFRELNFTNNYYDNFSDLPVDVNGDGYPDLVRVTWFAKKISSTSSSPSSPTSTTTARPTKSSRRKTARRRPGTK